MNKKLVHLLGTLLLIGLCQSSPATPGEAPLIQRVEVDPVKWCLVISGANFGDSAPLVALGGTTLRVKHISAGQLVATLPADVRPATYRLVVADARDGTKADTFLLEISPAFLYRSHPRGH